MKNILEIDMESKLGALFVNCQQGGALIISLEEMVHHQSLTPVATGRATSDGFVNDNIRQKNPEIFT